MRNNFGIWEIYAHIANIADQSAGEPKYKMKK